MSLGAQEVTCQIGTYVYDGVQHLSLTSIIKTSSFTDNKQGVQIKTSKSTKILHYWPGFHKLGMAEVKSSLEEYKCELNSNLLACHLVKENENCKEVLKLTRASNNQELFTVPHVENIPMEEVLEDFKAAGICH
jgi:hypothetical protein